MKAIETLYSQIIFKSKLEANWAKWFDDHEIRWSYEPQGFAIGNVWYLPDFVLPEINTIVEVKGLLKRIEKVKTFYNELDRENRRYAEYVWAKLNSEQQNALGSVPAFADSQAQLNPHYLFLLAGSPPPIFYNIYEDDLYLGKCSVCGKFWFCTSIGSYECRACGTHNGDHDLVGHLELLKKPQDWR